MKILEILKRLLFFDRKRKEPIEEPKLSKEELFMRELQKRPIMSSRVNPLAPMTFEELLYYMSPVKNMKPSDPGMYKFFNLFARMSKHLEEARKYSKQAVDKYTVMPDSVPQAIKVRGIQEQMSAIRFRLDIYDYSGALEFAILKSNLFALYQEAKKIDPEGVSRYERMIDKKMRKAERA